MLRAGAVSATLADADPGSLVGSVVAERYEVLELLGAGAMGRVYRARHVHMHKVVALKVLHRQTKENPELVIRFEREAVAAGRINHPNVAAATDFGRLPDGSFYLVLEYVSGRSLGALLEQEGALPVRRSLRIAEQILGALSAAHRAGIVHRDLKPDNVMLVLDTEATTSDTDRLDVVKVLDFGLAKLASEDVADTQLTQAGAIYGTPQYMSPEQASGAGVDLRADLYAAGVILYEMLAGKPPFEAEQIMPLLVKHMTEPPPPLPEQIPSGLRRVVMRLLAKSPGDRFASADEALVALTECYGLAEGGFRGPMSSAPRSHGRADSSLSEVLGAVRERVWPVLARPVEVRGVRVPLGAFIAVGFGLLLALASWSRPAERSNAQAEKVLQPESAARGEGSTPASKSNQEPMDQELGKVIEAAKLGSDPALYALEHRADADRSDAEWMALCQAYLMRRKVNEALVAYGHALEKSAVHASDMGMLGALRYLVDDENFAPAIIEFVAKRLPDVAADFLFDVWSKTSAKTRSTELAKAELDSAQVHAHQSEAIELAFAIRGAEDCSAQTALLPKLVLRGDERAVPRLREIKQDTVCAKQAGKVLDEALTQASLRKAPRFPLLRRWRWKVGSGVAPGETTGSESKPEKKKKFILF